MFKKLIKWLKQISVSNTKNVSDKKLTQKSNIYVNIVCGETGWTYDKAKKHMDEFKEMGISYDTYVTQRFYRSSKKRTKEKLALLARKEEEYIERVCDATGWTREYAIKEMDRVKNKFGVSRFKYCSYRFYTMDDESLQKRLDRWNETARNQIKYVMEQSGWTWKQARMHMNKVRTVYALPPDYYVLYRMWELTDEQIDSYARRKDSDRLYAKYNVKQEAAVLKDKALFDRVYKDYIKRKFWVNKDTNYEEFCLFINDLEYIFVKPIDSGGGQGTEKIKVADYSVKELYEYLMNKEKILVEECVVQHPEIDKFVPGCVNTIRVVTILKDDVCHFISAGIRLGNNGIVDNFHKDGMVCDIDINTGTIVTPAIDRSGVTYEKHPKSGYEFVGFKIPNWDMVLKLAEDAIRVQKGVNYVGWDIAICEDKAVIIEGNCAPDLVLVQAPYARKKEGKKYLFKPFF